MILFCGVICFEKLFCHLLVVQQLLNSGRVNQQQYNQAVQMAQQLQKLIK